MYSVVTQPTVELEIMTLFISVDKIGMFYYFIIIVFSTYCIGLTGVAALWCVELYFPRLICPMSLIVVGKKTLLFRLAYK